MSEEIFPVVDEQGQIVGSARRSEVHGNPTLLHPVVHCLVVGAQGDLLLQRRSIHKDIQPGRWDTSVGGHVVFGETIEQALFREIEEEIGLHAKSVSVRKLYQYIHRSAIEAELVHTYDCVSDGPFIRQQEEIDELRFWSSDEIRAALGSGVFTPNFEQEYARYVSMGQRGVFNERR